MIKLPAKVGHVKVTKISSSYDKEYTDGDSEDVLLELFKSEDSETRRQQLLSTGPEWRLLYHIAYTRENLFNWYDFGENVNALEVGSGCGALTGLLSDKCAKVDALDISPRRSLINAHRNRDKNNVEILVGNLQDLKSSASYDLVTSVGVLEYAGRFIKDTDPYAAFVSQLAKQLKPGGTMMLAIENRLGIKYWSGSKEDHTGRLFDSIEGYPNDNGIKTFGKQELTSLLNGAGFDKLDFYYPFPDYKMPVDVYSDSYSPGADGKISSDLFPTPAPDQERLFLFSEELAIQSVAANGLFGDFANSFLVFARKKI